MNRFLRYSFALFLVACSVPNFAILPEEDAGLVDLCGAQIENGKSCGGQCPVCENGQACDTVADCASGVCEANVCSAAATCSDQKINGAETDTDCGGGACPACALELRCTRASDCVSTLCDAGVCAPMPTCSDEAINGLETDTDCGGGVCDDCPVEAHCTRGDDCGSGLCKAGICSVPSADPVCNDSLKNAAETDVDCGGDTCDPCEVDKRCGVSADCVTLVCSTVCQPAGCNDNVRNGNETDKDCGGTCAGCDVGLVCKSGVDCKSVSCSGGHCIATTCTDKIKNGTETGKDCGGGGCGVCPTSEGCGKASDCESLVCAANKTCSAATCSDGVKNGTESVTDCGKGCKGCVKGQFCNSAADCASATCTQSTCVPSTPTGGFLDPSTWIATASHSISSPQWAIDGTFANRWSTGTVQALGMWFALDMRQTQYIFSIDLDTEGAAGDTPALFDVYVSTAADGTFPAVPTIKSVVGKSTTHIDFGKATPARYVKFVITSAKNNWWSIRELYVAD